METLILRLLGSTYVKIGFGGLLAFLSVVGGIYVGNALIGSNGRLLSHAPNPRAGQEVGDLYVEFEVGDLFPLENYIEADGRQANFEQLLQSQGKETVLLFVTFGCKPCLRLIEHWNTRVHPSLKPNVQVVVCLPQDRREVPEEHKHLVADKRVIYYDEEYFGSQYHFGFYPTILAVDKYGFVNHIQFGFGRSAFDRELLKFSMISNR